MKLSSAIHNSFRMTTRSRNTKLTILFWNYLRTMAFPLSSRVQECCTGQRIRVIATLSPSFFASSSLDVFSCCPVAAARPGHCPTYLT